MRVFIAQLEKGALPRFVSVAVRNLFAELYEGKVKITVERYTPSRSNNQNSYYWKVLVNGVKKHLNRMGNELSEKDVHEYIKRRVCPDLCEYTKEVILPDGEIDEVTAYSTKHLTTDQFSQLGERVRQWAAANGLQLQLPHEQIKEDI